MEPIAEDDSFPDQLTEETFADLHAFAVDVVGDAAVVRFSRTRNNYPVIDITPRRKGARSIWLGADQWIAVQIGDRGGCWELEYTPDGTAFAKNLINAVVDGRVEERRGFGRSEVAVTFEDGSVHRETGIAGCLAMLVPLLGWRGRSEVCIDRPYR